MRTSSLKLNDSLKLQLEKLLAQIVCDIKNPKDAQSFLKDFFNQSEYDTFVKRLAIAYWLKKKRSYSNIKQNLKVSSATIASIQSEMERPGMKLAIKIAEADEWANLWAEKIKKIAGLR